VLSQLPKARSATVSAKTSGDVTDHDQILCNPQNPLGRTYPRSTLIAYAKWCEANDVHLVSDEIYAMSVYDSLHPASGQQEGFTSVLSLRDEELGEGYDRARLHGMSFPLSGVWRGGRPSAALCSCAAVGAGCLMVLWMVS
jgi:hypothetical protein